MKDNEIMTLNLLDCRHCNYLARNGKIVLEKQYFHHENVIIKYMK
jgi:hypothetical protein